LEEVELSEIACGNENGTTTLKNILAIF
jgi:hypothetical protein